VASQINNHHKNFNTISIKKIIRDWKREFNRLNKEVVEQKFHATKISLRKKIIASGIKFQIPILSDILKWIKIKIGSAK